MVLLIRDHEKSDFSRFLFCEILSTKRPRCLRRRQRVLRCMLPTIPFVFDQINDQEYPSFPRYPLDGGPSCTINAIDTPLATNWCDIHYFSPLCLRLNLARYSNAQNPYICLPLTNIQHPPTPRSTSYSAWCSSSIPGRHNTQRQGCHQP